MNSIICKICNREILREERKYIHICVCGIYSAYYYKNKCSYKEYIDYGKNTIEIVKKNHNDNFVYLSLFLDGIPKLEKTLPELTPQEAKKWLQKIKTYQLMS